MSGFDPEHPSENRAALLELVDDDTDLESAEIIDPATGETLFSARKEADPWDFRFFLFLSGHLADGAERFDLTEAIRETARAYFGHRLWADADNRKIKAFRHPGEPEIVLM